MTAEEFRRKQIAIHQTPRPPRGVCRPGCDIYGNNAASQAIIEEMAAEESERVRQTQLAHQQMMAERRKRGEVWLRPMGIDEWYVPGTRTIHDYGADPDDIIIDVNFRGRTVL